MKTWVGTGVGWKENRKKKRLPTSYIGLFWRGGRGVKREKETLIKKHADWKVAQPWGLPWLPCILSSCAQAKHSLPWKMWRLEGLFDFKCPLSSSRFNLIESIILWRSIVPWWDDDNTLLSHSKADKTHGEIDSSQYINEHISMNMRKHANHN